MALNSDAHYRHHCLRCLSNFWQLQLYSLTTPQESNCNQVMLKINLYADNNLLYIPHPNSISLRHNPF